jgi:hypothetical protein
MRPWLHNPPGGRGASGEKKHAGGVGPEVDAGTGLIQIKPADSYRHRVHNPLTRHQRMRTTSRQVVLAAAGACALLAAQAACAQQWADDSYSRGSNPYGFKDRGSHDHTSHGHDSHSHDFDGHASHDRASRGHDTHAHDFHGRDFHGFTSRERDVWEGGQWQHGWHDDRLAWWWVAGGVWYFYAQPTYPYPTYVPPAVIVQQPPPIPTGLPPAQFWYYCDNPAGYFPYVAACNGPWRQVTATPPK